MKKPNQTIKKLLAGENVVIAAIGDSLTSGWMVRNGYTAFLQERLADLYPKARINFIGAGVPGDTAHDGLYRLRRDVLDANPDCVLVQFGLNDAFYGYSPAQFLASMERIVEEIRLDCAAEIILATSSYLGSSDLNDHALLFYAQIEKIATTQEIPIALVHSYWQKQIAHGVNWEDLVQYDGVHPTVKGYSLMAEAIAELFLP